MTNAQNNVSLVCQILAGSWIAMVVGYAMACVAVVVAG